MSCCQTRLRPEARIKLETWILTRRASDATLRLLHTLYIQMPAARSKSRALRRIRHQNLRFCIRTVDRKISLQNTRKHHGQPTARLKRRTEQRSIIRTARLAIRRLAQSVRFAKRSIGSATSRAARVYEDASL